MREIRFAPCWVNQILPSEAKAIPIGFASRCRILMSEKRLVAESNTSSRLPPELPKPAAVG